MVEPRICMDGMDDEVASNSATYLPSRSDLAWLNTALFRMGREACMAFHHLGRRLT